MKKASIKLYSIVLYLYTMMGVHAWFMWPLENRNSFVLRFAVMATLSLLSYVFMKVNNLKFTTYPNVLIGLLLFLFAYVYGRDIGIKLIVYTILVVFSLWVLLSTRLYYEIITRNLINLLALTMFPGIILHVIFLVNGISFPGFPMLHPNNSNYLFMNYIFLLKGIGNYEDDGLRFFSYFLEPGFLGTFFAFLLYTIRFDFKNYKMAVILLISIMLSFSLAGYLLTFLAYLLTQIHERKSVSKLISLSILLIAGYYASKEYNNGNNYVNTKILERLKVDSDKGIKGNNRVGAGADFYFEKSLNDGSFITGIGFKKITAINGGKGWENVQDYGNQIRGAGYKIFILQKGLISIILYMLAYYLIGVKGKRNTRYAWGYCVIIFVTFLQAAYPDSYSWLIPFIIGTGSLNVSNNNNHLRNNEHSIFITH